MLGRLNPDFNCERIMCSCLAPQEFLDNLEEFSVGKYKRITYDRYELPCPGIKTCNI